LLEKNCFLGQGIHFLKKKNLFFFTVDLTHLTEYLCFVIFSLETKKTTNSFTKEFGWYCLSCPCLSWYLFTGT
jgi:hypothetical protein